MASTVDRSPMHSPLGHDAKRPKGTTILIGFSFMLRHIVVELFELLTISISRHSKAYA